MSTPVGLVIPVKPLAAAKSRLRGAADGGVGDPARHAELALALALDTLAAARAAALVAAIVVVTDEPRIALPGVRVVPDVGRGLNAALEHGAGFLPPELPRAALQADLPALKPHELDAALAVGGRAFVADARGDGTTLLLAAAGAPLDPRFGAGSAAAHAATGAVSIRGGLAGLRRDVDTEADLRAACLLGVGPRTGELLVCR